MKKRQPGNCFRCAFNGMKDAACLSCSWNGEVSHGGRSLVSLDAAANIEMILDGRVSEEWLYARRADRGGTTVPGLHVDVVEWLQRLYADIAGLDDDGTAVVHGIAHGRGFAEIGAEIGVSVAEVSARARRILSARPYLNAVVRLARRGGLPGTFPVAPGRSGARGLDDEDERRTG